MSTATEIIERTEGRPELASMIRRVRIRNYKSIKSCDVELGPFTILVGRNGSGKSNFLDAIRLVSEGLREPGLQVSGTPSPWGSVADTGPRPFLETQIALDLSLDSGAEARFEIVLGVLETSYGVVRESLVIRENGEDKDHYHCERGRVTKSSTGFMPPAIPGPIYLGRAADVPEFRPVYDALASSAFYDLVPDAMRGPEPEIDSSRQWLTRDGSNIASSYDFLASKQPETRERLLASLSLVVPEFSDVRREQFGPYSLLVFRRAPIARTASKGPFEYLGPQTFYARGVSDGTLRALGILTAINQLASDGRPIRLVGIEEPETALHPAAAGALMDAFRDAACHTQVLVTTHGADLLDRFDPEEDRILAVELREGRTEIGPLDLASRDAIRDHLFSAGELLRMDQLGIDRLDLARQGQPPASGPDGGP